ncbi:DUF6230 family protein [Actinokineospora sp. NBRC 105648]|uniref:DUF6230 family protein n=1 Tax=Actinokineospora sp. NBRC 105648 TaxID=3032206 RepID=UPI00332ECEC3
MAPPPEQTLGPHGQLLRLRAAVHAALGPDQRQRVRRLPAQQAARRRANGEAMARAGFQSAKLDGLCAAIHQTILGLPYTLKLNAGSPVDGTPNGGPDVIDAYNLILEAKAVQGAQSQFSEMVLGKTAHQVQMGGQPLEGGTVGAFGLEAGVVQLTALSADANTAEISGNITLPKLNLVIVPGTVNC